ncbi:L-threonylcarbamoyladenylate synthase [Phaeovulum vinaykumarii]|uniref:Threonylcarbamoyl-AMP synthase n=1 Tax=Phaeovulum vinaykumarii TaxID=407234 RepID=A0A1N7K9Y8_9RHOB|nr:L-threonylcarbamoyladenylate synthase [Phaeovulum vinaykumarii]SIS58406.1 translation factor SUA5 [Phaeovulum vinaykumarii]SOB93783.1 translation factor SUA5 [Phaeovulum vinaykumarii]
MSSQTRILSPDTAGIAAAAALLRAGGLVAFPTETVYGLGGDATDPAAVAGIYAAKGRPAFNPLIVHVPDLAAAQVIARIEGQALALARAFWPGPLTLVVPLRAGAVCDLVTAGLSTVALRVPAHPLAQALLRETDRPLAAPSANPSGRISPTAAAHVAEGLSGRIAGILDGGPCTVGVESTIIAPDPLRLLRPGGLALEEIETVAGTRAGQEMTPARPAAPGQLASHYAPEAAVRLNATAALGDEVLIGFGSVAGDLNLSPAGDTTEAASRLFALLRAADALAAGRGGSGIAVAPIPETGLGRAINDRLRRAAAPRG